MFKILLNCSTLMKGGSLQVARSVFEEAIKDIEIEWFFAINKSQYLLVEDLLNTVLKKERLLILEDSPARSKQMRKNFKSLVDGYSFDAVFTLFGPAYVKFLAPHLCGIADGWVTHANKEAYQLLPTFKEKLRTFLLCRYKLWWYKKADKWCVEAEVAKKGYRVKTKIPSEAIAVISNAVNQIFQEYSTAIVERELSDIVNVFCLSADYWHKNHQVIPDILCSLKEKSHYQFNFIITLPEKSAVFVQLMQKAIEKGVDKNIINLGPLTLKEVINQYKICNILFFPSVLETFSITPLEALYMNMPMIVSDISVNKEVLKDYANYVNPFDINEITDKFLQLIANYQQETYKLQALKRNNYFESVASSQNRFAAYKKILKEMLNE